MVEADSGVRGRLTYDWRPNASYGGLNLGWSPDGAHIIYNRWVRGSGREVWMVATDGGDLRRLIDGWDPAWSPDGSHLAYSTICDGESEVWVVDVAGSGSWLLAEGAYSPACSPAGGTGTGPSRSVLTDAWTPCQTFPWFCLSQWTGD